MNGCGLDVLLLLESRAMGCIMCGSSPKINSTASREIWPTHEATLCKDDQRKGDFRAGVLCWAYSEEKG